MDDLDIKPPSSLGSLKNVPPLPGVTGKNQIDTSPIGLLHLSAILYVDRPCISYNIDFNVYSFYCRVLTFQGKTVNKTETVKVL